MELLVIQNKIYEIRGYKVMLDFDLAELYGIETKVLKQAVRRNLKRFTGDDFMFELTKEELSRSQIVTLNKGRGSNIKYQPFAFTELGVAMLSSVLSSDTAIEVNRSIMRAFVAIRNYVLQQVETSKELEELWRSINDLSEDTRKEFDDIYLALAEMAAKQKLLTEIKNKPRNPIGYTKPEKN